MIKRIKLLSVMALVATSAAVQCAGDIVDTMLNMGKNNAITLAAAVALANGAYCYSQRDYDDKGAYRTAGGEEDNAVTDGVYSCVYGTGYTVFENLRNGENPSLMANAEQSVVNAVCFWVTKQITRLDAYKNLNRNSFLLRWVPITTKVDEGAKMLATFAIVKSLVGKVVTPAAAA